MSKIRLAEYHYRKAVEIHPNNAVLLGCVGMVSHGLNPGSRDRNVIFEMLIPPLFLLRLSNGVGAVMRRLPYLIKRGSSHQKTRWFVIVEPKSLSL